MQIIAKYTPKVQAWLGSKTKPEPWLHVVIEGKMFRGLKSASRQIQYEWRVYVWDTRKVIEHGQTIKNNLGGSLPAYFIPPHDNGAKLSDGYAVPDYSKI